MDSEPLSDVAPISTQSGHDVLYGGWSIQYKVLEKRKPPPMPVSLRRLERKVIIASQIEPSKDEGDEDVDGLRTPRTPPEERERPRTPLEQREERRATRMKDAERGLDFSGLRLLMTLIDMEGMRRIRTAFEEGGGSLPLAKFVITIQAVLNKGKTPSRHRAEQLCTLFAWITLGQGTRMLWSSFSAFIEKCAAYDSSEVAVEQLSTYSPSVVQDNAPLMDDYEATKADKIEAVRQFRKDGKVLLTAWERRKQFEQGKLAEGAGGRVRVTQEKGARLGQLLVHDADRVRWFPSIQKLTVCDRRGVVRIYTPDGNHRRTIAAHRGAVSNAAVLLNQNRLITSSMDHTFRLYECSSGLFQERGVVQQECAQLALESSDHFERLYSGGTDGLLRIWDAHSMVKWRYQQPTPHHAIRIHKDLVTDLKVMPGTPYVASCSLDRTVSVWDIHRHRRVDHMEGHRLGVYRIAYSSANKLIISVGGDHVAGCWAPGLHNNLVHNLRGHHTTLVDVAAVDGVHEVITLDQSGIFKVWDTRTFGCFQTFSFVEHPVVLPVAAKSFDFCRPASFCYMSGFERLAACGYVMAFFDADRKERAWLTDSKPIVSIVYHQESQSIATAAGGDIKIWDAGSGRLIRVYRSLSEGVFTTMTLSDDGFLLCTGDEYGRLRLVNYASGHVMRELTVHDNEPVVEMRDWAVHNVILSAGWDRKLQIHNAVNGEVIRSFEVNAPRDPNCMDMSTELFVVAAGCSGNPDLGTGAEWLDKVASTQRERCWTPINTLVQGADIQVEEEEKEKEDVIEPPKGEVLMDEVRGPDGQVLLWEFPSGRSLGALNHAADVVAVQLLTPYPALVSADALGGLYLWSIRPASPSNQLLLEWKNYHTGSIPRAVTCMLYDRDQRILYTGDRMGEVKAWNLKPALQLAGLELFAIHVGHHEGYLTSALLEHAHLAREQHQGIERLYKAADRMELHQSAAPPPLSLRSVRGASVSVSSKVMTVHLKDVPLLQRWKAHDESVTCIYRTQYPPGLLTGSKDRRVRSWSLEGKYYGTLRMGGRQYATPGWWFPVDSSGARKEQMEVTREVMQKIEK